MSLPDSKALTAILWGVGFAMAIVFFFMITRSNNSFEPSKDTYLNVINKREILSQMRVNLSESVEMEKSAVMAPTDEESQDFAGQSSASSAAVENDLQQIQPLIDATSLQDEVKLIGEFKNCWSEFRKLDQVILGLAVQNTNRKATTLLEEKGGAAMQRFELALKEVMRSNFQAQAAKEGRVAGSAWHAIAAGEHIVNLLNSHIAETSNEKMDQIEVQIQLADKEVVQSLDELGGIGDSENQDALSQARMAFAEFMEVTAKVRELSRKNSNIKSLELSIGKKRIIAAQCAEILAAFQNAVQSRPFKSSK